MTRKHTKYTPEWLGDTNKLITKTEKVDGNDKLVIERLVNERNEFDVEKQRLETIKTQAEEYENKILAKDREISETLPKYKKFAGGGTGTLWSDGTTADGWKSRVKNWVENINGGDNICKGKIKKDDLGATADIDFEITEEEAIALWSRVVKAFEGINATDFDGKKGTANKDGITPAAAKICLDNIQTQAKNMAKNKSFGRDGWDVGLTYSNFDDTKEKGQKVLDTPLATDRINWNELVNLAKFIDADDWSKNLDQSNFGTEIEWNIYSKGDQYTADELKEFVGNISTTPKLYKTGLKKDPKTNKWNLEAPVAVAKMKTVRDWAKLVLVLENSALTKIIHGNSSTADTTNNDNIYQKLFRDMRDWNTFTETNDFSIDGVDENKAKIDKKLLIQKASSLSLEYDAKKSEVDRKKSDKEAEIEVLIKDKLEELRQTLTTHKIDKPFEDKSGETDGIDNRKTEKEIKTLLETLTDIRYLENDDEEAKSSLDDENTAYDALKELYDKYKSSRCFEFNLQDVTTTADKCKKIKEKDADELQKYHDSFENWESKIKFTDLQTQQLKDIKIAMGKEKDPKESLETYQTKLKEIDALLTDTVITQEIVDDWQKQNNFKTSDTMTAELKRVMVEGVINPDFQKIMTKADAEITDLGKLLTKKKAKEVITMIRRWEYDEGRDVWKDVEKGDRRKKLVWTLELKDPDNNKKYLDDKELTDKEINDVLYQIATGAKTLRSEKKADEISDNNNNNGGDNKEMSAMKEWFGFGSVGKSLLSYSGILLLIGGALALAFWKNITEWWNGPTEENEETITEEAKSNDEE